MLEIRLLVAALYSGSKWAKFPHINYNFSRVCLPAKVAS